METLLSLDTQALLAVNGFHTPFLDWLMPWVTWRFTWIPLYIFMAAMLFIRLGWREALTWLVAIGLCIACADQLCSHWLRPLVGRLRPSNPDNPIEPYVVLVNGYRSGAFGFPSSHAVNCAALSTMLIAIFRRPWVAWVMGLWVALNCWSRLYLGVHYPGDILVGLLLGFLFGLLFYSLARLFLERFVYPLKPAP